MEEKARSGTFCPKCKATLISDIEKCPFCNTKLLQESLLNNENKIKDTNDWQTSLKSSVRKYYGFVKEKTNGLLDTFDKRMLKKVCIFTATGIGVCTILFTGFLIFDKINIANFEKIKNELSSQEVADIEIPSVENIDDLTPLNHSSAIYQNQSFYMFQLTSLPRHNKTENKTYLLSAYIQKPNNVLEYFCSDAFGTISTDKCDINLTLRSGPNANKKVDLLFISQNDQIKRMSNYIINGNSFETYEVKNENSLKYYMISDPIDDMYFVYSITYYDLDSSVKNFNFLTHLVFIEKCS